MLYRWKVFYIVFPCYKRDENMTQKKFKYCKLTQLWHAKTTNNNRKKLDFIYIYIIIIYIYSKDFDTNNLEEVYVELHYINSYCYFYLKDYIYIYIKKFI